MLFKNYWGSIGCWWTMCLPKFDICQCTLGSNCFKSQTNYWCPNFFQKKVLSNVRSEIHLDRRNIVSSGQSVRVSKNIYSGLPLVIFQVSTPRRTMEITLNDNTSSQKVFFFFFLFSGTTLSWKIRNFEKAENVLSLPH